MKRISKYILPLFLLFTVACDTEIDVPSPSAGSGSTTLDFSNYIAIGNSLTAGYTDGGLYEEAQEQSFPAILSKQFMEVNSDITFTQPMVSGNGSGYLKLTSLSLTTGAFVITDQEASSDFLTKASGSPFNNLGVPGIAVGDIKTAGYGASPSQGNPYFWRMLASDEEMSTYQQFVEDAEPSFFTCWLGNNDILGYATSGGVSSLTDSSTFMTNYTDLIDNLIDQGAQGVLATLPDVTNIPFFQLIPYNSIVISSEADAETANASYAALIDPQIRSAVKTEVIKLAVTISAVSSEVTPAVAEAAVYQQVYSNAISNGASEEEAETAAENYVASDEGQTAITSLTNQINSELSDHLQGNETSEELDAAFEQIDYQLANNTELQAAIAQGITDTTNAYDNDQLPEAQKDALDAQIDASTADQISQLQAAGIYPVFVVGANPFVIEVPVTESNPLGIRQMQEGELMLYSAAADGVIDSSNPTITLQPKEDQYVLTADELEVLHNHWNYFNSIIDSYSSNDNIVVVNTNSLLSDVKEGLFTGTESINSDYIQGGAFSLDAIHMTPKGYAVIANTMISAINNKFGSSISVVSTNDYRGVILP